MTVDTSTWTEVTDEAALRELLGTPSGGAVSKERTALHELDRQWIAASPFLLMATSGADGTCDVSPKGDPAGFVHVLDDTTIAMPERPGNKRADGWVNVLANPHVGLIFVVPGRADTLRVNGRARLVSEAPFLDDDDRARATARCWRWSSRSSRCSTTAARRSCGRSCGTRRRWDADGPAAPRRHRAHPRAAADRPRGARRVLRPGVRREALRQHKD